MLTVTGEATPFQGKTELELCIGKQKLKHTVLIADIGTREFWGWTSSKLINVNNENKRGRNLVFCK